MAIQKKLAAMFVLCVAGCVPSLHPLYTEKTLVYDPSIVGTWQQDEEGRERWEFVGDPNDKLYQLTITEKEGEQSKLIAHLVDVDGQRFFDFYPSDSAKLEGGDWLKFHLVPAHLFFKVEKTETVFTLAVIQPDEIRDLLKEKPQLVKHELIEDDRVVLTDTPENLQKFLLDGLKVEEFFGDSVELTPVKPGIKN